MSPAPGSVKIWWDESVQAYRMATPYNENFVNLLKQLVPSSDRLWDPQKRMWTITERMMPQVKDLAEKVYKTTATVITKQQAQSAGAPPKSVQSSPLDSLMASFVKLLPFEVARKAYREAAMQLHPDRGGNLDQMTALNQAWQRIEKEHFKRD